MREGRREPSLNSNAKKGSVFICKIARACEHSQRPVLPPSDNPCFRFRAGREKKYKKSQPPSRWLMLLARFLRTGGEGEGGGGVGGRG